jgi:hypothetical protein
VVPKKLALVVPALPVNRHRLSCEKETQAVRVSKNVKNVFLIFKSFNMEKAGDNIVTGALFNLSRSSHEIVKIWLIAFVLVCNGTYRSCSRCGCLCNQPICILYITEIADRCTVVI